MKLWGHHMDLGLMIKNDNDDNTKTTIAMITRIGSVLSMNMIIVTT